MSTASALTLPGFARGAPGAVLADLLPAATPPVPRP